MNKEKLRKKLKNIIESIKVYKETFRDITQEISELEKEHKLIKLQTKNRIKNATDDDGKKMFKNKTERDIQLKKAMSNNEELQQKIEQKKKDVEGIKIALSQKRYEFRAEEILSRV